MSDTSGRGPPPVEELPPEAAVDDLEAGRFYRARVNGVVDYGVFVDVNDSVSGLVHESSLDRDRAYEVGDELVVELETVRENGDVAFEPVDVDLEEATVETPGSDGTGAGDGSASTTVSSAALGDAVDDTVRIEGEVVQANQTGGPTVFQVRDAEGVVPCAAFEAAGVRAYPEVGVGDLVRVEGTVEQRNGAVQVEVEAVDPTSDDDLADRLAGAVEERAAPAEVDPLVEWSALESMHDDLARVARIVREAVLTGRPVRMRHHADGDGMCAAVPLERAVRAFVEKVYADPQAPRHLVKRLPTKAPFYEMEDGIRDLNFALGDRDRHGHRLPLLLMLDNGSTAEDVPSYEAIGEYDVPVVAVDHHHPDPEAVDPHLEAHVNPYLYGEDYAVTTGMMAVEIARMVAPEITPTVRHLPAVGGVSDRSEADAMADYLALAAEEGYDDDDLRDVSEALDYAAYHLRYDAGRGLVDDVLGLDDADRQDALVDHLASASREAVRAQTDRVEPHVDAHTLDNGAHLYRIDVEEHARRFSYPAPGRTTAAVHDRRVEATGDPVITVGYGPDFAVLRSDGVRLDIPAMVADLEEQVAGGGVSGGGHLVVGSIKFLPGRREEVLDALVDRVAEAEVDETLGSTSAATLDD
ncbi:RecJ like exonuclease [Halobacteriales archaeon SW_7_71_33]|nr:MAG: RecJ like exonuclease [Halobacteriales archaeon SW_7_71_33]